ncbi:hypothetical protein EIL87_19470 [Saccharopolyspora rhizosphaerae]|uniref:Uncharacterized protein n=1 Tax=Saccharopolyspora rhizosphaerae TaxID=2492662 RepID=A0A426JPB7_9PSEU|nr:hypothetical protein [Saccharopolyspora rhizosphaerae]RRO14981.1 hypothetical protein EIL87_19470 [Saccharopolyspora rhizosphaerae]
MISIDDPDLRVVVWSYDDTEAASAALARATDWNPDDPAVLRHHLALPGDVVDTAAAVLAQDDWILRPGGRADELSVSGLTPLVALRVQQLDALHCSQETSRMAGLAQRHGGETFGWDALQRGPG